MQMKKDPLHQSEAAIQSLSSKNRIYVYNTKTFMKGHSWNVPNATNLIGSHIFNFKLWIKLTPSIPFQIACMCTNAVLGYFAVLQQLQARRHAAQRERMSRLQEQHEALKKMASYGMFCAYVCSLIKEWTEITRGFHNGHQLVASWLHLVTDGSDWSALDLT